jgi:hypothetical protein
MKKLAALLLFAAFAIAAWAQVTTGRLEGVVNDPQGAAVPGAQVKVINTETGQAFDTIADEKGLWAVPSVASGTYKVTVNHPGFKTTTVENVKVEVGVPATVNTKLEVGALAETVEVQAGAEVLQTASATVTSTLVGRQLHELPFTSRNLTELIVTQPGSATPGVPRSTSVYGMPQSALNVTKDGINIQDNSNKSGDGFFNAIFPRADAIEEMTISAAAAGADSNAEGSMQVKMVTRSGSNAFHGGLFEQHRNEKFDANSYFNNLNGTAPRDHIVFNQFGGFVGGPIKRNKLFFFAHMEALQLPQTYSEPTGRVLTPDALKGIFTYRDSANAVKQVNLFQLAASNGFTSTPDPIIGKTLSQIDGLVEGQAGLKSRIASNADYNTNNLDFQSKGGNYRRFPTTKFDYNLTEKHHIEFVYDYQTNIRRPDGVNVGTASPVFPGTGSVLNGAEAGNQGGIVFQAVAALRSTLSSHVTSEIRFGLNGGTVVFNNGVNPSDFSQWLGYAPTFGFGLQSPFRNTGQTRRNTPLKQGNANVTWSKGAHLFNFGTSFTQINSWTTGANGSQIVPGIAFGTATGDPIITGATNIFTAANFPGASTTDMQTNAPALYALLTGRVSSITRSVVADETTKQYGAFQPVVRNRQREFGIYYQDSFRVHPRLTVNYGVRWDRQNPPVNLNNVYTRPEYAGVWGVSGIGNLFKPGTLTGQVPTYNATAQDERGYEIRNKQFSPSIGLAWQIPSGDSPLRWILGKNAVLRAGYAINTIREDAGTLAVWGTNQGRTLSTSVDPTNTPANFGAPGSVLFRGNLPSRPFPATPSYPVPIVAGNSVADFSPNLRTGYVQSWNLGLQREITRDTVVEFRYVGNHGTDLWRQVNINEVNIFESGFLSEFQQAQQNLALARGCATPDPVCMGLNRAKSSNYFGLAGQTALPMIVTAIGSNTDATTASQIEQGQAGALANAIATNASRMAKLTAAGKPINLFQVNPTLGSGSALLEVNGGNTNYNSLQVEVTRRFSKGLLVQASYVWSHAITNEYSAGVGGSYTTLRNVGYDKISSPYDIRQAVKLNWVYELPFGPRRHFLGHLGNPVARKAAEGWELASVTRLQTGSPIRLTSGRATFNGNDSGVILHNMTNSQLQDMMSIRKVDLAATSTSKALGAVYYLPQSLIDNTNAAFEVNGKTLKDLNTSAPYIGPADQAGQLASRALLYGPGQQKWDFSLVKKTGITERVNLEFRMQALNAINRTNFLLFVPGSGITTTLGVNGTGFGQTTGAYKDLSNTNDPGGRIVEFSLRLNF